MVNSHEWGSKTKVYERLIGLLKIENTKLCKAVLQKLAQILDETIYEVVLQESLGRILPLNTWALNEYVNIILAKIIIIAPDLSEEILNQVQKLNDKYLIIKSLAAMVRLSPINANLV